MTLVDVISEKQKINIKEIGVKPGEKLFEELVTETEKDRQFLVMICTYYYQKQLIYFLIELKKNTKNISIFLI